MAAIPRRQPNSNRHRHSATRCSVPVHHSATHCSRCACASTRADNSSSCSQRVGRLRPCWPVAGWSSAKTIRRPRVPIITKLPTHTCTTAPSVMSPVPSSAEIRLRLAVTPRPQCRTPIHPRTSATVVQPAATWRYSLPSAGRSVLLNFLYLFIFICNSNGHNIIILLLLSTGVVSPCDFPCRPNIANPYLCNDDIDPKYTYSTSFKLYTQGY